MTFALSWGVSLDSISVAVRRASRLKDRTMCITFGASCSWMQMNNTHVDVHTSNTYIWDMQCWNYLVVEWLFHSAEGSVKECVRSSHVAWDNVLLCVCVCVRVRVSECVSLSVCARMHIIGEACTTPAHVSTSCLCHQLGRQPPTYQCYHSYNWGWS